MLKHPSVCNPRFPPRSNENDKAQNGALKAAIQPYRCVPAQKRSAGEGEQKLYLIGVHLSPQTTAVLGLFDARMLLGGPRAHRQCNGVISRSGS